MSKPDVDIRGLYGRKLLEVLSNDKGIIDYNCMFEVIVGFSVGRETNEQDPLVPGARLPNNMRRIDTE